MRARISTTLLALGSLFVGFGLISISAPPESPRTTPSEIFPTPAPRADPLVPRRVSVSGADSAASDSDQTPTPPPAMASGNEPRHPSDALEDLDTLADSLDEASEETIRNTLLAAIDREQSHRALFVMGEVVEHVATARRVRIVFETGPEPGRESAAALLAGPTGGAAFDGLRVFPLLAYGAATVGPQALLHLIEHPQTGQIEIDAPHRASLEQTIPIIRADVAHLDGHDGDGWVVAVLDTGVDQTHPMYADRLVDEACFSVESDCPNGLTEMFGLGAAVPCAMAGCGHGTRVAGIAVGEEPGGSLVGVAPHADLIAIQIFSNVSGEPAAFASDILAGLQHVLALSAIYPIASANLSLGGSVFTSEATCDTTVASQRAAVAQLRNAGILTVAAAGNEFFTNAITTPACLSNVIGVGATSDSDVVATFSNSAPFLRLLAPGESVESSRLGGGTSISSGTSMAAAHVAGAIASILEAVPTATPDEIENALALSGVPILDARNGVTTPRIRVENTISLLEASSTGGGSTPASSGDSSGGGGGGCGLVGLEPLIVLGLARLGRARRVRHGSPSAPKV